MAIYKVYLKPRFSVHERSAAEMDSHGGGWKAVLMLLVPLFGISQDRRFRIRWLLWAFYFGRGNRRIWRII